MATSFLSFTFIADTTVAYLPTVTRTLVVKIATGVSDALSANLPPVAISVFTFSPFTVPPVSLTPEVLLDLRISPRIFAKMALMA